jgi:hypothetical protein
VHFAVLGGAELGGALEQGVEQEEIVKVRAAIEALAKAIVDESSRRSPAQSQDFTYRGTSTNTEPGPNDRFKTL